MPRHRLRLQSEGNSRPLFGRLYSEEKRFGGPIFLGWESPFPLGRGDVAHIDRAFETSGDLCETGRTSPDIGLLGSSSPVADLVAIRSKAAVSSRREERVVYLWGIASVADYVSSGGGWFALARATVSAAEYVSYVGGCTPSSRRIVATVGVALYPRGCNLSAAECPSPRSALLCIFPVFRR